LCEVGEVPSLLWKDIRQTRRVDDIATMKTIKRQIGGVRRRRSQDQEDEDDAEDGGGGGSYFKRF